MPRHKIDCLNYCIYCGFLPNDSVIRVNGGHYSDCPTLQARDGCPGCCCDSWEECTCCCGKMAAEDLKTMGVEVKDASKGTK